MKVRRDASVPILLAVLALGCATTVNPVTGQREVTTMSPTREAAVGRDAASQVETEIGLVRDPELTRYVDTIGQRLAQKSPRQDVVYRFHVADMAEANAFALPGGYVYVSRGLLALANDEDELANVIGHEIGHVAARHSAQRETRAMGVGILSTLGTVAAGVLGGAAAAQAASQLGQVAGAGLIASYGRDQERQADEVGQKLAAEAGWDPDGMADFLATLGQEEVVRTGTERRPTFLDSHPAPRERSATAHQRAAALPRAPESPVARDRADFLRRIEGITVGPDPREGVFRGNLFLHPELDFAVGFPAGWQAQNGKSAVGAISPQRDAVVVLELQSGSTDPRDAARRWVDANRLSVVESGLARVSSFSAYRVLAEGQSQQGTVALQATFVAHPEGMFRITGMTSPNAWRAYSTAFERTAGSFRRVSSEERAGIRPVRLRIAEARSGETLADLGRRTGNQWDARETALANGLEPGVRLTAGQLVKVAVPD
jgi:predicted Zn-dependent protease